MFPRSILKVEKPLVIMMFVSLALGFVNLAACSVWVRQPTLHTQAVWFRFGAWLCDGAYRQNGPEG